MKRLLLLVVAVVVALPAGAAHAISLGVAGGVLTIAPGAGESSIAPTIDVVPGPCSWPTRAGDDLGSPKGTLDDPAGCLLTDLPDRAPGAQCAVTDSLGDVADVAGHEVAARLTACGLSGVSRVEVRGGPGDDRIRFDPRYAFGATTVVSTGDGPDEVLAADGAVEDIDCGGGFDVATEDPGDRSVGCEDGNGTHEVAAGAHDGRIARDGARLTADWSSARGNELHRVVGGVFTDDGETIGVSTLAAGPPALGDGCLLVAHDDHARCAASGIDAIDVTGPSARRDAFVLNMGLQAGFAGAVAIHAGPGVGTLDTHDGVAERVDCGLSFDAVTADAKDTVEGSCERSEGEGTLLAQDPGRIAARARTQTGRLPFHYGNSGQAVLVKVTCPAMVKAGCGGTLELTLTRGQKLAFGATGYAVDPGASRWIGVTAGVDTGPFHAARESLLHDRFFAEKRAHGNLKVKVVAARGFGAHRRTVKTVRVEAR